MTQKSTDRPTVITKATVQKLQAALWDGFSVEMACHVSGVERSTYYQHLQSDPDFADKMILAQDWTTRNVPSKSLAQVIDKDDLKAAQWWLERRARANYS